MREKCHSSGPPQLVTAKTIAQVINQPASRVRRVLAKRPYIKPAAVVGKVKIYWSDAIVMVRLEISAIDVQQQAEAYRVPAGVIHWGTEFIIARSSGDRAKATVARKNLERLSASEQFIAALAKERLETRKEKGGKDDR